MDDIATNYPFAWELLSARERVKIWDMLAL